MDRPKIINMNEDGLNILTIHHNDLDGRFSKELINLSHNKCNIKEVELANPHDFTDDIVHLASGIDVVYVLDISLHEKHYRDLINVAHSVFVFDHHKTGMDVCEKLDEEFETFFNCTYDWSKSSCLNIFNYVFDYLNETIDMHKICKIISDYDTWNFKLGDDIHKIALYLMNTKVNYRNFLKNPRFDDAIKKGGVLFESMDSTAKFLFENNYGLFCNAFDNKTIVFSCLDPSIASYVLNKALEVYDVDLAVCFVYRGQKITFSLRSRNDVDSSKIAKLYGGGGHKYAAGFSMDNYINVSNFLGLV